MTEDELVKQLRDAEDAYRRANYRAAEGLAFIAIESAQAYTGERRLNYLGAAHNQLGAILSESGRLQPAIQMLQKAAQFHEEAKDYANASITIANIGNTYRYMNRWQPAITAYKQAIEKARTGNRLDLAAAGALNLLHFYESLSLDTSDAASEEFSELCALLQHIPDTSKEQVLAALQLRAHWAGKRGDKREAMRLYEEALRLAPQVGPSQDAEMKQIYASYLATLGRHRQAATALKDAAARLHAMNDHRAGAAHADLALAAYKSGDYRAADKAHEIALDEMQAQYEALNLNGRFNFAEKSGSLARRYIDTLLLRGELKKAFPVMERFLGRIVRDHHFRMNRKRQGGRPIRVGASGRIFLEPADEKQTAALSTRRNLTILRLYINKDSGSYCAIFRPRRAPRFAFKRLQPKQYEEVISSESEIARGAGQPGSAQPPAGRPTRSAFAQLVREERLRATLERLSALVLSPEARAVLRKDKGDLLIVCDHDLSHIPWQALPNGRGYLADRWTVSVCDSVTLFSAIDPSLNAAPRLGPEATLIVANSEAETRKYRLLPMTPEETLEFPALPGVRREVEVILGLDGAHGGLSVGLTGETAKPDLVGQGLRHCGVAHFACHGNRALADGWRSSLVLRGGDVTVDQVMDWHTNATLVVLSACETGTSSWNPDSSVGFPSAFITAGAQAVVSALWPIDDDATVTFAEALHGKMRQGAHVAEAFRYAVDRLRSAPETSSPQIWAAYQLHGDPFRHVDVKLAPPPVFHGSAIIVSGQTRGERLDMAALKDIVLEPNEGLDIAPGGKITKFVNGAPQPSAGSAA